MPAELTVRLVEVIVAVPGFRTQKLALVTTLLDAPTYSAEALGQLYFRRWAVELFSATSKSRSAWTCCAAGPRPWCARKS